MVISRNIVFFIVFQISVHQLACAMNSMDEEGHLFEQSLARKSGWVAFPPFAKLAIILEGLALLGTSVALIVKSASSPPCLPTISPIPVLPSTWAVWNSITGVYGDSASEASRFNTVSGVVVDSYTGLQWQAMGSSERYTWNTTAGIDSVQAYCTNQTTGGFNDWRLPTIVQLLTIVDYNSFGPAIDKMVFQNTSTSGYWSADVVAGSPSSAWSIIFNDGTIYDGGLTSRFPVRCVRAGPIERYTDEAGEPLRATSRQVKDSLTSLIWQRSFAPGTLTWSASGKFGSAQAYCSQLVIGSHGAGSWRLPDIKELNTLMDIRIKSPGPAIDVTAFPQTPSTSFWSSTVYASDSQYAWYLSFGSSSANRDSINFPYYVRCVRGNGAL